MRTLLLATTALLLPVATPAVAATSVLTPLSLTSTTYTQNFDTLASSGTSGALPTGFQISETGTSAAVDGLYTAGTGSSATGDVYSFGLDGSTDRALGSVFSGTNSSLFGAVFTNGLGSTITALTFNFAGEQWRSAAATSDRLDFQYRLSGGAVDTGTWLDFNSLDIVALVNGTTGALNGNLAANRAIYTATIGGLTIAAGQSFGFRFVDADGPGGADAGLALDDLTLTATTGATAAVPEPATWAMMIAGFGLMGGALRRRAGRPVLA